MTTIIDFLEFLVGRVYDPLKNIEAYYAGGYDFDTRYLCIDVEWIVCAIIACVLIYWTLKGLFRLFRIIKG